MSKDLDKRQGHTWNVWAYAIDQWQLMRCLLMAYRVVALFIFTELERRFFDDESKNNFFSHEKTLCDVTYATYTIFFLIMNHCVIRIV